MTQPAILPFVANAGAILTALAPALTLVGALGGVWLGGRMQTRQAERIYEKQRQDRLSDEARAASVQREIAGQRKAFAAHRFARVLERYTKACATVGSDHNEPGSEISKVPDLKFPRDIDWEAIGALRAAELRDFQNTIPLVQGFAIGRAERAEDDDIAKEVFSDTSARLGRSAWRIAETLRKEAGLPPFTFVEDGWDYVAFLSED